MGYGTILLDVNDDEGYAARLAAAVDVAQRQQAHLVGLACTGPLGVPGGISSKGIAQLVEEQRSQMIAATEAAAQRFSERAAALQLRSFEKRVALAPADIALVEQARYADLVVVSRVHGFRSQLSHQALVHVLMSVGRPVLVVPEAPPQLPIGKRILLGWNGSREAMRALADAMPLLEKAEQIDLLLLNAKPRSTGDASDPGADLGTYLARHRLSVAVHNEPTTIDIGNALLSRAADLDSDLVVMGAFGQSHLKEYWLGGATETVLTSSPVPVLMSH